MNTCSNNPNTCPRLLALSFIVIYSRVENNLFDECKRQMKRNMCTIVRYAKQHREQYLVFTIALFVTHYVNNEFSLALVIGALEKRLNTLVKCFYFSSFLLHYDTVVNEKCFIVFGVSRLKKRRNIFVASPKSCNFSNQKRFNNPNVSMLS